MPHHNSELPSVRDLQSVTLLESRLRRAVAWGYGRGVCRSSVRSWPLVLGVVLCACVAAGCGNDTGLPSSGAGGSGTGGMGMGGTNGGLGGTATGGMGMGGTNSGFGGTATGGMGMGGTNGGVGGAGGGARIPVNHRVSHETCAWGRQPMSPCVPKPGSLRDTQTNCSVSGDCGSGTNGRCLPRYGGHSIGTYCQCVYDECLSDQDCSAGAVCNCGWESTSAVTAATTGNRCLLGDCQIDADCGPRGYCSPSRRPSCSLPYDSSSNECLVGFYCHGDGDACIDDADCVGGGNWGSYCAHDSTTGTWVCMPYMSSD